jgi:hypothetical protein
MTSMPPMKPTNAPRVLVSTSPSTISTMQARLSQRRQPRCVMKDPSAMTAPEAKYMPSVFASSIPGPPTPSSRSPLRPIANPKMPSSAQPSMFAISRSRSRSGVSTIR